MTRINTENLNTMNKNLGKLFKELNLNALPKLENEMKENSILNKELILKHFSNWKQYASSKECLNTIQYFYTLNLYQTSIKKAVQDVVKEFEKKDNETFNISLETFMKSITSKALSLLKKDNNVNIYINSMMKAYKGKQQDLETFNLYFKRFFGFEPTKEDLNSLEVLMIGKKSIISNNELVQKLVNIFTVLQVHCGVFSQKNVKTTFKNVTKTLTFVTENDFYLEDNKTVNPKYFQFLGERYNVNIVGMKDEKAQKTMNELAKKFVVKVPGELQKSELMKEVPFIITKEKEESATK